MTPTLSYAWLPDGRTLLRGAALQYATRGMRVFPIVGKVPMVSSGFKAATRDPAAIRRWNWNRATGIGWSIPPGLFVVDVDGRHGGIQSLADLERQHGRLPETLEAVTGSGGLHIVLRLPAGIEAKQTAGEIAAGIDTRVGGKGYVVVAPSLHPDTQLAYRWQTRAPVAAAPAWLLDRVRVRPARPRGPCTPTQVTCGNLYAAAALAGEVREVSQKAEGSRNHRLFAAWMRLTRDEDVAPHLDREQVRRELAGAARACGLTDAEITRTLRDERRAA